MHIWSLVNIYIGPIYMFAMFICVYLSNFHAAYMQMSAIRCNYMLRCTSAPAKQKAPKLSHYYPNTYSRITDANASVRSMPIRDGT